MTAGPGNNLYMPPETVQEEGATRYNTAIDIFSFGVVSLFTLTQTFPKDLKPHNYHDPRTRRIVGRSEIERRQHYIQSMQAALGETHPLVRLTLDCLEYLPEDRPSAVEVLRRLKEVGRTVPLDCTETKQELIRQIVRKDVEIDDLITRKEEEIRGKEMLIQQIQVEYQQQLTECRTQLREKEEKLSEKEEEVRRNQTQLSKKDRQLSEKDRQLFDKDAQIKRLQATVDRLQLSGQLRSLELQPREEGSQGSRQRDVSVPFSKKVSPTSTYGGCPLCTCLLAWRKISLVIFSVCLTVVHTLCT